MTEFGVVTCLKLPWVLSRTEDASTEKPGTERVHQSIPDRRLRQWKTTVALAVWLHDPIQFMEGRHQVLVSSLSPLPWAGLMMASSAVLVKRPSHASLKKFASL